MNITPPGDSRLRNPASIERGKRKEKKTRRKLKANERETEAKKERAMLDNSKCERGRQDALNRG